MRVCLCCCVRVWVGGKGGGILYVCVLARVCVGECFCMWVCVCACVRVNDREDGTERERECVTMYECVLASMREMRGFEREFMCV